MNKQCKYDSLTDETSNLNKRYQEFLIVQYLLNSLQFQILVCRWSKYNVRKVFQHKAVNMV